MTESESAILKRFRAALADLYGERLERVVLFGSRARGDAEPESDYDVAVFLHGLTNRLAETKRIADITTDILLRPDSRGEIINAMAYPAGAYVQRTPIMHEIRADGIDL